MCHEGKLIESEEELADHFNEFFIKKVEALLEKIDVNQVRDPLEKLRSKLRDFKGHFELKMFLKRK